MRDLTNITVNGVALEAILSVQKRDEVVEFNQAQAKEQRMIIRGHIVTRRTRNHSHSRTGKGRIIYSAALAGGQA